MSDNKLEPTVFATASSGKVLASVWVGSPGQSDALVVQTYLTEAQARRFARLLIESADALPREVSGADLGIGEAA
jgi:hypothetical protein